MMRNLFLALLLVNLVYLVWNQWVVNSEPTGVTLTDAESAPTLKLVSELGDEAGSEQGDYDATRLAIVDHEDGPGDDRSLQSSRCVSMGPFVELTKAAEAMAALTTAGFSPNQRLAEGEIYSGYWVYIPPLPSRPDAEQVRDTLEQYHISDFYIVPSGESRNAVSLGVYSEYRRAQRRAGEVSPLGYEAEITIRHRMGQVYWVDFELAPGQLIDPVEFKSKPEQIIRLEDRSC